MFQEATVIWSPDSGRAQTRARRSTRHTMLCRGMTFVSRQPRVPRQSRSIGGERSVWPVVLCMCPTRSVPTVYFISSIFRADLNPPARIS